MKEIPEEQIEQIFIELAETELKPFQEEYDVWLQIPAVQEYNMSLDKRGVGKNSKRQWLRSLWHISTYLKRHPKHFDIGECATLLVKIKAGEVKQLGLSYDGTRMAMRNWFITKGISGEKLTAEGISGELSESFGKRAQDKLTKEQRRKFLVALHQIVNELDDYVLSLEWDLLPCWLYYTGTRIEASLKARIENMTPKDVEKMRKVGTVIARVVDKGKHKRGRMTWRKLCTGELKNKIVRLLEARGNPQEGLLFDRLVNADNVRTVFREAYQKAGIKGVSQPCHIWRHTADQDLLDATDWNYDLVGAILGSADTRTMKLCYGKMGETVRERGLRKAMGLPVEEVKKEFKF